MDFSVALFGYYKADPAGVDIRRAQPGDVIAWKPLKDANKWTPLEKKLFLIITLTGVEQSQIEALCEPEYDLDSYNLYEKPMVYSLYDLKYYPKMSQAEKQKKYEAYYLALEYESNRPAKNWRKRRFNLPFTDMEKKAIDTEKMLLKYIEYIPNITIPHTDLYDKFHQRYVDKEDNIGLFKPRTIHEIIANKTADEILLKERS